MSSGKIISAGHICLDMSLPFENDSAVDAGDLFLPGTLINVGNAKFSLGGSVSNTGVGLKVLGADVELMSAVGRDNFGDMIIKMLEDHGMDTSSMIISDKLDTAYSVIMAPKGIDRIVLHHTGANDMFTPDQLDYNKISKANIFHFGYPPLMKKMYEDEGKGFTELVKRVHSTGTAVSVDMAMFETNSECGHQDWRRILEKTVPYIDFFVPSIEELCLMLDRKRYDEWLERAGGKTVTKVLNYEEDIRPLADQLMDMGARVLFIKCGAPGMYFRSSGKDELATMGGGLGERLADPWADREIFEKSFYVKNVVSGSGAGDTTIAAFLKATLDGYPLEEVLDLAAGTGAMCIQAFDAVSGLLPFDELRKKIDGGWKREQF